MAHARAAAVYVGVTTLGLPIAHVARTLGVSAAVVRTGLVRGPDLLRARGLSTDALISREKGKVL